MASPPSGAAKPGRDGAASAIASAIAAARIHRRRAGTALAGCAARDRAAVANLFVFIVRLIVHAHQSSRDGGLRAERPTLDAHPGV